jgi:hypothetical protein
VSFYPVSSRPAMPEVEVPGGDQAAVMVAVPVSALACPVRADSDGDGRSALTVTGSSPIRTGDRVALCKIVAVTPALVRRDGRVQAKGQPCDHARLGVAEQELDRRCGPGTIDRIAAGVLLIGKKVKAVARALPRRDQEQRLAAHPRRRAQPAHPGSARADPLRRHLGAGHRLTAPAGPARGYTPAQPAQPCPNTAVCALSTIAPAAADASADRPLVTTCPG